MIVEMEQKKESKESKEGRRVITTSSEQIEKIMHGVKFDDEEEQSSEAVDEDTIINHDGFLKKRHGDNKKPPSGMLIHLDFSGITVDTLLARLDCSFKWSTRYFIIKGGTLFSYVSAADAHAKKSYDMFGMHLDTQSYKSADPFSFCLKKEKPALHLILAAGNPNEYKEWLRAISEAVQKQPSKPPKRVQGEKSGISLSAKKKIGEKVVTSHLGKNILQEMLNEDAVTLLSSLQSYFTKAVGEKEAKDMYNNILKFLVKIYMCCSEGTLNRKEFIDNLKSPLFKLFSEIIDSYELSFAFDPAQLTKDVAELSKVLEKLLSPMFTADHIIEMKSIFNHFTLPKSWKQFYTEDAYKEDCATSVKTLRKIWNELRSP